ncbi:penicillin-binding protein activator [Pantoea stewartii]|uniref:penicillin-binding protein activator n=1 Tax=Pantoea stewartii TaxID=66269 RepID=UPI0005419D29|nr:penicillin-binding protein activator [Pantoea stewartii]KKW50987.1 penicillin-binding protein [Pantoea ananatis]KHE00642.1 penicillin-binding protein [Pantoea stewartii]KHN61074.1 penicillin-binding protein [Pantoea stewartii]MDF7786591.1 penicillin-binding protein activator [Pantoea stewartii]QIE97426.1 penicillin-binding protein activator [Pantoea stewartii]
MLPSKIVRHKAGRFVPVLLAGLILAACSGQGPKSQSVDIQGPATNNSAYYLQQVQQSSDDSKTDWQLLAIRALLKEGKYPQADQAIGELPNQLSSTQQQELRLLKAQSLIGQQKVADAQQLLSQVKTSELSQDQLARYYDLQIASAQGKTSLALLRAYIAQEPLLKGDARQKNIDATWQALTQLSQQDMNALVINADENILQGWLDLLTAWHANAQDANMLKSAIKDWQTRYPDNPASKTLPTQLSQVQNFTKASTSTIALLLPLNGQAQMFASAIQKGFNDAKNGVIPAAPQATPGSAQDPIAMNQQQPADANAVVSPSAAPTATTQTGTAQQPATTAQQPQQQQQPSAQPASNAQVKVYDTSSQPIAQVMQQAQQDGATLVVGPLLKNNVETVANSQTPLNVLALNEPEHIQNHPNMCYFALSPEDEARDAAHHIWDQGKRQPLLLLPRNGLGDRVATAFAKEWQSLGGGTVLQQRFGSVSELKQGINSGAGISMSGTPVVIPSASQPQNVSVAGLTIPAPQTSAPAASESGAVDAAYIVSTQDELQLIKPMISMRTGSRSNVALYASSRSAQAGAGPDFRLEMEGLQYSDIPLLSGANPGLMQQAARSFNNDYSLVRLYAMGMDAWTLANHFNQMRQVPGFSLDGNTGKLSATPDCVINRKLTWNQYRQGNIVPAS